MVRSHLSIQVNLSKSVQTPCVSPFFVQLEKWHSTVTLLPLWLGSPSAVSTFCKSASNSKSKASSSALLEAAGGCGFTESAGGTGRGPFQLSKLYIKSSLVILPYNEYIYIYIINDCNCNLMRYPNG